MNPRGRRSSGMLSGSPVLVGAVAVLVTIVAVFLAYNANEGLPFVPTYSLTAEVQNSAGLVRGNEVRIGGSRVGVVSEISGVAHRDGSTSAKLKLELDPDVKPLPVDSTILIRPRSALGLKYVEITTGRSRRGFTEGATIPVERSTARPVEFDDFFNTFDDPTRVGARSNLHTFGTAFAGRGESLNRAFAGLESLTRELEPAMRNLASPRTEWDEFFPALEQAAAEAAPVAGAQASVWVALDTTFTAWESVSEPLQRAISGGPPALETATRELPAQRPFLREGEELFRRWRPAFAALSDAAPDLAVAFRVGEPALRRSPAFNRRLTRTLRTLERFGDDERVPRGLARLTTTATTLRPLMEFIAPAQTTCNYFALLFRNGASALTEGDSVGTMLRFYPLALPVPPGSEAGPAGVPSNGPAPAAGAPPKEVSLTDDSFLHSNPYPNTAAPGQERECESGNESYSASRLRNRLAIGNLPGGQGTFSAPTPEEPAVRSFRTGVHPVRAGAIALIVIAIFSYFAFTKDLPFTRGYRIQAVFENSNLVQQRSPVRIAGVDVGEVVAVGRYKDTHLSVVTMEIEEGGRPVHRDATIKVRPRLFLEGNFYLDLQPGTPDAGEVPDGGVLPAGQTSRPVQLDQVLTALQSDTRSSLQRTLRGLGSAFSSEPTPEDDADQDPEVRGLTGAEALNKTFEHSPEALRDSAIVNEALLGEAPRDLSRMIRGIARLSSGLARDEAALRDLVSNFNTSMAAMASRAPELSETFRLLGPTAANARRGFGSIERALPPTTAFAREIIPGVRETPPTIAASEPWLDQAEKFFGPAELGGLVEELGPATSDLARLGHESRKFLPVVDRFNRCMLEVFIPTVKLRVDDGPFSSGVENYKEFWYAMVGQAGEGQSFDGNGPFLRLAAPGGVQTITTGKTNYTGEPMFGRVTTPPLRTRPAFPGRLPPLRRDVPCHRNPVPDIHGPASVGPADGSRPGAAPPPVPSLSSRTASAMPASASRLVPVASLAWGERP